MPLIGFAFTERALDFLDELPPKLRRQVTKKAKVLHTEPYPPTAKRLSNVTTPEGEPVFRERSGDFRILYVVRTKPAEVIILDIGYRKDVYRMPKTSTPPDEMKMKEGEFDAMMRGALGVAAPTQDASEPKPKPPRLASYPAKPRKPKAADGRDG